MQQPICVRSKVKSRLYADAIPGYFATNHSHINCYIDMSDLKHKQSLAMTVARSFAARMAGMPVDTILCLEGTEYIGAYLAQELTHESLSGMNTGRDLFLVEPDSNINGQFIFADNLRPMIDGKAVFVMVASASTGQTLSQIAECVEYYGGHVVGTRHCSPISPSWTANRWSACLPVWISPTIRSVPTARTVRPARRVSRSTRLSPRAAIASCKNDMDAIKKVMSFRHDLFSVTCSAERLPASIRRDR